MDDTQSAAWRPHWPGFVARDEHFLRLNVWCAVAGVTITVAGVVGTPDGGTKPFSYGLTPTSDRQPTTRVFPIEAGVLLCCQAFASAGAPLGAQAFVRVELLQGKESSASSLGTALQGYVTANSPRTYPNDTIQRSVDGRGTWRIVPGTAPAAGADFVDTVPANTRWLVVAVAYQLAAAVAVANRTPVLTVDDGANVIWETFNNVAVTSGQTAKYRAGAGVTLNTVNTLDVQDALPEALLLPAGSRIRSVTGGIQAADQFGAIFYNVEEWLDL
jgi:hypothetical protein